MNARRRKSLERIAERVKEEALPLLRDSRITVFLAGGSIDDKRTLRHQLACAFESKPSDFRLIQPETLLGRLIQYNYDLLEIENSLASGVHAVVICPESPGSYAELGAFCNHEELRKRLVVVTPERYRKSQGFIRQGPLRYLDKTGKSVVWYDSNVGIDRLLEQVRAKIRRKAPPDNRITNPLLAEMFVGPLLYVAGPLHETEVVEIAQQLEPGQLEKVTVACRVAVTSLMRAHLIARDQKGLYVTPLGVSTFQDTRTSKNVALIRCILDNLRIEALNIFGRRPWRLERGEGIAS